MNHGLPSPNLAPSEPVTWSVHDGPPTRLLSIGTEWQTEAAGGINRYTYGLAQGLSGLRVAQKWVVIGDRPAANTERCAVTAAAPPVANLLYRLRAVRRTVSDLSSDADLLATHFALYATPALSACKSLPHVCHFHGPWAAESAVEGGGRISVATKRWLERRTYQSARIVVTLSRAFAHIAARDYGVEESKIRVVPGGVDLGVFDSAFSKPEARDQLGWSQDRPTILCVRRLVHRVGLEQLVEAMPQVVAACPDVLLYIAGKGPLREQLAAQINALGLTNSIKLLGFVPDDHLPLTYRAADLSIVPSQSLEGFGLVIPESLAAGTPAIVTPVGGMPEVVQDLEPALVTTSATPGAIADALTTALAGILHLPTSAECREYARKRFDWTVIAQQVLAVYREAIAAHG